MNRGIPKSAYDALASLRSAEEHPSADLLNGYVERSLSATEQSEVTQHLAACEDCREVVFLASGAAQEPLAAAIVQPTPGWRGWKWAVPAVALLALASSVLVEHSGWFARRPAATYIAHSNAVILPAPGAGNQVAIDSNASALSDRPAPKATPKHRDRLQATVIPGNKESSGHASSPADTIAATSNYDRDALAGMMSPAAKSTPSSAAVGGALKPEATASAAAQAISPLQIAVDQQSPSRPLGALGHSSFHSMNKAALGTAGSSSHPSVIIRSQWRITPEGHLERSQTADNWTQALADQPTQFRTVTVVSNDVWAGGNNGALFHSTDGGEHWSPVVLNAGGHPETGNVVSIHFDTVSQGSISTDTGSTWITSDRGQSWNK
jgi:Putative zinc-finger/Photosynthesis system II assembly factor YCF48